MLSSFFNTVFYNPIYNALVTLTALVPGSDAGVAIIILTLAIRLLLLPLSLSAARTQRVMKTLEPRLKELKEKHKGNREQEALETLELYRTANINPFASIITVLIQIPVLLALYFVFMHESFSVVNTARVYAGTPLPEQVSLAFLGLISVLDKSIGLAIVAGATQWYQARLALRGTMQPVVTSGMQADFQKVMSTQLVYVFPIIIGVISYTTSSAIALYFITTNLAGCAQEWYVRRVLARDRGMSEAAVTA